MSEEPEFKPGGLGDLSGAITEMTGVRPMMVEVGNSAKAAVFSMADLKNALLGDETLDEIIASKTCSKNLGCGKSLVKDDGSPVYVFDTKEEAQTYEMEYRRTGLCPSCLNQSLTALDGGWQLGPDGCNGMCLSAADIGVPSAGGIAYAHPYCPEHGDGERPEANDLPDYTEQGLDG